jgi:hypothetical protein
MGRLLAITLALAIGATPCWAGKPKHKKEKKSVSTRVEVVFSVEQRDLVHGYFVETHGRGHCPPGLAKKNNGCLPPGQAKKMYAVGHPLPPGMRVDVVPSALEIRLGAPPEGYRYGIIDGDLVKLAVGTFLVVDAIQGLVD